MKVALLAGEAYIGGNREQSGIASERDDRGADAGEFKVTVQMLEALLPNEEGAQPTDMNCAGAVAERVNVWEELFRVAVSMAV